MTASDLLENLQGMFSWNYIHSNIFSRFKLTTTHLCVANTHSHELLLLQNVYLYHSFPGATNETLLDKFHAQHSQDGYYEVPQMKEDTFLVKHYAGMVKYSIVDFREKNSDLMRHDIMVVLKNSSFAFVRELVGTYFWYT